jgi:hypothetical protein
VAVGRTRAKPQAALVPNLHPLCFPLTSRHFPGGILVKSWVVNKSSIRGRRFNSSRHILQIPHLRCAALAAGKFDYRHWPAETEYSPVPAYSTKLAQCAHFGPGLVQAAQAAIQHNRFSNKDLCYVKA